MNQQNAKLKSGPADTEPLMSAGVIFTTLGFQKRNNYSLTMEKWINE